MLEAIHDLSPMRVLLVEDEVLLSEMMSEALREHGFEVQAFNNAGDAIRHLTCGARCDLLLTDINLPGSTDGEALARLVRELRPTLPVVYASGSVCRLDQVQAVAGAMLVAKPYNPDRLCETVTRMVLQQRTYESIPPSARNRSSQ